VKLAHVTRSLLVAAPALVLSGCPVKHPPPSIAAGTWAHSGSQVDEASCASGSEIEPNGDVSMPNIGPGGACTSQTVKGSVSDDVDVFRIDGTACDDSSPTAKLTVGSGDDDVRLCLFVVCANGRTGVSSACSGDASSSGQQPVLQMLPEGMHACCRLGTGSVTTPANCDSQYSRIPTKKPTWHSYLVVDRVRDTACTPYSVDYHF